MNKHSKYIDAVNDAQTKLCSHDYEKHTVFMVMRDIVDAAELDLSAATSECRNLRAELEKERGRVNSLMREIDRLRSAMVTLKSHEPVSVTVSAIALSAGEGEAQ